MYAQCSQWCSATAHACSDVVSATGLHCTTVVRIQTAEVLYNACTALLLPRSCTAVVYAGATASRAFNSFAMACPTAAASHF
jgi:hypothetical protein